MNSPPADTLRVTLGTAGHIDHGKTALVKLLTGCDTDRLPEEQRRGMTIDLGFAPCALPNGRRLGIVDVPGHERFVRNMVAGAVGMDVVLLVIAADDGVMPQTVEHFHIVRLLGVQRGLIAVTKNDLVTPERVAAVVAQARALVASSFLEGAPVVPVSAKTGAGYEAFHATLAAVVEAAAERDAAGPFRMPLENAFALPGRGTIVTGIPVSGTVRPDDELEVLPGGARLRVRGLQVYGRDAPAAAAGACAALNVTALSPRELPRGTVLAAPGYFSLTRFVNARFFHLAHLTDRMLSRLPVVFHAGTSAVAAHLRLPDLCPLPPGGEAYVQVELDEPMVVAPGDRFIVRRPAPATTLGGGCVVAADTRRMRRTRGNWGDQCRRREEAFRQPETALAYVLQDAGNRALTLEEWAAAALVEHGAAHELAGKLAADGIAVALPGERYAHAETMRAAQARVRDHLAAEHRRAPLSAGFPLRDLFKGWAGDRALADAALAALAAAGEVRSGPAGFFLPGRATALEGDAAQLAGRILERYRTTGYRSPRRDELAAQLGVEDRAVQPLVDRLAQTGDLVVMSEKVILHREHAAAARRQIVAFIRAQGPLETNTFKELLQTTRKYAIAILEYWDRQRLTFRVGDTRKLVRPDGG